MENSSAPLAGEYIKNKVDTPMHSSNEIKNESSSDMEDSGNFTPYDPNKPPKPKKSKKNTNDNYKIEILNKDAKTELKFKIIVVGNSGVGKSCLSLRATEDIFKESHQLTLGTEIYNFKVKINDKSMNLQIWDTCGQEKYKSLIKNYYQNSSLAIIVYSVVDQVSFDDVNEWYKQIKLNTSQDCKIFLIANKVDLPERKITTEQGNKTKNDFQFDLFMETSAKSGFNSKELFINAASVLYKEHETLKMYEKNPNMNEEKILKNIKKKKFALKKDEDEDEEDEDDENESSCCS
jgi:small GTP-binding protein